MGGVLTAASALADPSLGEVSLTDQDFGRIVALVRQHSGIALSDSKRDLVYGRLRRRLRALRLGSFAAYVAVLEGPDGAEEQVRMINAITTNLTGFFREPHHFDHLAQSILPKLPRGQRRLRIWSAGCSSGEEPYTIAMTLRSAMPDLDSWDARILATDIDTDMVAHGEAGRYAADRASAIPPHLRRAHTQAVGSQVEMGAELKSLISFLPLNLLQAWPMRGPFDAIFCRNVVIYFDKPTQRILFDRFAEMLCPGGHLFVGHSETLYRVSERFQHLGRTIYRKLR
ncbi:CheR family methyltransferase [Falsiroseomonas tokyonensis]|uniref:Chemotaxis protein methyltransferase n=1 Tax=Falsiroseomonas tokyonensis TaxID=430521 RepID=A0ABV7C0R3_9PROT|nr:protein-glutamate O-methyltransferase [Falsiroseomonas tokyonensis]MBU8541070.1 protein-glutamate O-methyltransferase [Falsiroseomonas tokyonensis]